jgi:hypothetical protein
MKAFFILLMVIGALLHAQHATAQKSSNLRSNRIQIAYVPPKNTAHATVFRLLKEQQVLEKLQQFLSPLRLPRALQLKVEGCDGVSRHNDFRWVG